MMTREAFTEAYIGRMVARHGEEKGRARFAALDCIALPCDCGASQCEGWAMIANDPLFIATHCETSVSADRLHEVPEGLPRTMADVPEDAR